MTMKNQTAVSLRRSPFFYVGDKFKLVPQLKEHFPTDIERFIDPFCGGGSVFLNVDAESYLINDINSYLIALHRLLLDSSNDVDGFWDKLTNIVNEYGLSASFLGRTVPDEYKIKFKKTYYAKFNKNSYMKLRADFNNDRSDMLKLYVLLIYGFNRMLRFNSSGDFNIPVGNVDFNQNVVNALNAYFEYVPEKDIKLASGATIEVRSSCVKNGLKFALFKVNQEHKQYIDVVGPYYNKAYKSYENMKDFYMRVIYVGETASVYSSIMNGSDAVLYITGGATKEMLHDIGYRKYMTAPADSRASKKGNYLVVQMSDSFSYQEFIEQLENAL